MRITHQDSSLLPDEWDHNHLHHLYLLLKHLHLLHYQTHEFKNEWKRIESNRIVKESLTSNPTHLTQSSNFLFVDSSLKTAILFSSIWQSKEHSEKVKIEDCCGSYTAFNPNSIWYPSSSSGAPYHSNQQEINKNWTRTEQKIVWPPNILSQKHRKVCLLPNNAIRINKTNISSLTKHRSFGDTSLQCSKISTTLSYRP